MMHGSVDPCIIYFQVELLYTLAEAYVDVTNSNDAPYAGPPMPFAICNGEEVVGYVLLGIEKLEEDDFLYKKFGDKTVYDLNRFMIDVKHQGKGFGKAAMLKIIEFLRTFPQGKADSVHLSYVTTNEAARRLYASVGFVETDHMHVEDDRLPCVLARYGL